MKCLHVVLLISWSVYISKLQRVPCCVTAEKHLKCSLCIWFHFTFTGVFMAAFTILKLISGIILIPSVHAFCLPNWLQIYKELTSLFFCLTICIILFLIFWLHFLKVTFLLFQPKSAYHSRYCTEGISSQCMFFYLFSLLSFSYLASGLLLRSQMLIWIRTLIEFQKPSYPVLMGKFSANDVELLMLQKFIYSFLRGRVVQETL